MELAGVVDVTINGQRMETALSSWMRLRWETPEIASGEVTVTLCIPKVAPAGWVMVVGGGTVEVLTLDMGCLRYTFTDARIDEEKVVAVSAQGMVTREFLFTSEHVTATVIEPASCTASVDAPVVCHVGSRGVIGIATAS